MPWIDTGEELQGAVMAEKPKKREKRAPKVGKAKMRKCRHCEQGLEVTAEQMRLHAAECLKKERG